jgi:hypothetical protein
MHLLVEALEQRLVPTRHLATDLSLSAVVNTTDDDHAVLVKHEASADVTVTVGDKSDGEHGKSEQQDHDQQDTSEPQDKEENDDQQSQPPPSQDPPPVAPPPSPGPTLTPNELFVTHLYADLLHRAPESTGLANWTAALGQGMTRTQVAQAIEASAECMSVEVQGLYNTVLHRPADAGGLAGFTTFLVGGGTIEQVKERILASPEYFQLAGGSADGFVTALYQDVLHRAPDAGGAAGWKAELAAGETRDQVAGAFLQSQEAETVVLESIYQEYLGRAADSSGLANFLAMLQHGVTQEQVVADVVGSDEYFSRA